jgi:hypothetical protein
MAPIEAASLIITSERAPAGMLSEIRAHGVEVIQVKVRDES